MLAYEEGEGYAVSAVEASISLGVAFIVMVENFEDVLGNPHGLGLQAAVLGMKPEQVFRQRLLGDRRHQPSRCQKQSSGL